MAEKPSRPVQVLPSSHSLTGAEKTRPTDSDISIKKISDSESLVFIDQKMMSMDLCLRVSALQQCFFSWVSAFSDWYDTKSSPLPLTSGS